MPYIKSTDAAAQLGVSIQTLRRYDAEGLIKTIRTPGGHRMYDINSFIRQTDHKKKVCYCRVSSHSQAIELQNQIDYMKERYPDYEIVSDIGSGINFNRKGLQQIIDYAISGELGVLAISYRDRLCRIGYDLIEHILTKYSDTQIIVDKDDIETPEEEIANDILQIMTVYTAKIHGMRSYKANKSRF